MKAKLLIEVTDDDRVNIEAQGDTVDFLEAIVTIMQNDEQFASIITASNEAYENGKENI